MAMMCNLWWLGRSTASWLAMQRDANVDASKRVKELYISDAWASGGGPSLHVDIYNETSNSWTTYITGLGQAREYLAAASLASGLVIFAGGWSGGCLTLELALAILW